MAVFYERGTPVGVNRHDKRGLALSIEFFTWQGGVARFETANKTSEFPGTDFSEFPASENSCFPKRLSCSQNVGGGDSRAVLCRKGRATVIWGGDDPWAPRGCRHGSPAPPRSISPAISSRILVCRAYPRLLARGSHGGAVQFPGEGTHMPPSVCAFCGCPESTGWLPQSQALVRAASLCRPSAFLVKQGAQFFLLAGDLQTRVVLR